MSLVSTAIGTAKKIKHKFADEIKAATPIYISPVRRINGVKLSERICAMTFDDGPCMAPPNPNCCTNLNANEGSVQNSDEKSIQTSSSEGVLSSDREVLESSLTMNLLRTLEKHNAKGTFDCVGDTSENYPDECGKIGTAMWGGTAYDHYPDFKMDSMAGIKNCPELTKRILSGGHEISCHSYVHRIWGSKPLVYGKRVHMNGIDDVISDLQRFDDLMKSEYGSDVKLSRPPHYVDKISKDFTSYDAYAVMGYQYMGAGPDGGGWLPCETYEKEVEAMVKVIKEPLEANPEAFCGCIIFQKDGCNMMKRTPVADALDKQLEILDSYGYKVVTVSELMALSQFEDCGPDDEAYKYAKAMLDKGMCPAYSDNCLHLDRPITKEEIAMMAFGWEATVSRVKDGAKQGSAYKYAINLAKEKGFDLARFDLSRPRIEILKALSEME